MTLSTIGCDLSVVGDISTLGQIHVLGEIHGDIECARLFVGDAGRVIGSVCADEVIVRGTVVGQIRGGHVTLHAGSRMKGDIFHDGLDLQPGATSMARRSISTRDQPRSSTAFAARP